MKAASLGARTADGGAGTALGAGTMVYWTSVAASLVEEVATNAATATPSSIPDREILFMMRAPHLGRYHCPPAANAPPQRWYSLGRRGLVTIAESGLKLP